MRNINKVTNVLKIPLAFFPAISAVLSSKDRPSEAASNWSTETAFDHVKAWRDTCLAFFFSSQHGMTALIWASGRGHTEVVDHLLEAGANPDAADKVRDMFV